MYLMKKLKSVNHRTADLNKQYNHEKKIQNINQKIEMVLGLFITLNNNRLIKYKLNLLSL